MTASNSGRWFVLAAALLWSTSGLFAKAPLFDDWPADQRGLMLAFWRALFAAVFLLPLARRPRWRWSLVPMVIAFAGMNVTFLSAMTIGTAANAIWLQSTAPFWVVGWSVLVERQALRTGEWLSFGCAAAGVGLILLFEMQGQSPTAALLGLAAGVCYAGVMISLRRLRDENTAWLIAVNQAASAAVLVPLVVAAGEWPSAGQFGVLAGFGALQMALPYWLFAWGLRQTESRHAALIVLAEPLVMPIWVLLVWGEAARWWTVAGGACILVGLLLRIRRSGV